MISKLSVRQIRIPDGFALNSQAYIHFLKINHLEDKLSRLLSELDRKEYSNLKEIGSKARALIMSGEFSAEIIREIESAYQLLCQTYGEDTSVAVRSSATAEDLPTASFAGQHESFLNISTAGNLIKACHRCFESLFTDRAIKYREDNGFDHMKVYLSVGVQKMVRSDMACSGVAFTLEPESGFRNIIHISSSWGLGENIVKGSVNPDEYFLFKPSLESGKKAVVSKKAGSKEITMVLGPKDQSGFGFTTINTDTPYEKRMMMTLSDEMAETIGKWSLEIEKHYGIPMDIEWAIDGVSQELFIVQARPETIHSKSNPYIIKQYLLKSKGEIITEGIAIGSAIASGTARVLNSPAEIDKLQKGDVLVTKQTNPDWDPVMKKASALITDQGGRTSHASIVARELGLSAVVGTINGSSRIKDGEQVTISCAEGKTGKVYRGLLEKTYSETDFKNRKLPKTKAMMILGDPEQAYRLSFYPNNGIGLMRLEFIINNVIGIHPMALINYNELVNAEAKAEIDAKTYLYPDRCTYFTEKLAYAVATIAAAFYPKDVIVRMSDFKTNEYANLCGGRQFEPEEENPMIGFRGASRYYHEKYREGFRLECEAMKFVREEMGLTNVKLMIPFCRTPEEGRLVCELMASYGLKRGENGLKIYVMAEIPSNVIRAKVFAEIFDGFSIGSNDLTQLTLGIDRDSSLISHLFDENDAAAREMISMVIKNAKASGSVIGLCGQAPSDYPEFAGFLIEQGIDSISFNPDALLKGIQNMCDAEDKMIKGIHSHLN